VAITVAVAEAIRQISAGLPELRWDVREDGQGGAILIGDGVALGDPWLQGETWIGFRIAFNYPYADVYPHFVRGDLARRDGGPLGQALSVTTFEGRPAVQISRASSRRDPTLETALLKLLKVMTWLRDRP
jgi:hypothetical protein